MTRESEVYIEEIANGHVPDKTSVEARAYRAEFKPFSPKDWARKTLELIMAKAVTESESAS
jgi:hypothetical protein